MKSTISGILLALLLIAMFGLTFNVDEAKSSEPPTVEWDRTYGTASEEQARHMIQTSDSGYVIAGYNIEWVPMREGGHDFWLVKTDMHGNTEWSQTYEVYIAAYSEPVIQTSDGGYAITGQGEGYDLWLIKTDALGNIEWARSYGGDDNYYAGSVIQTDDGGYAIAGKKGSFYAGEQDVWLAKTDASGNVEWDRTYGGSNNDIQYSLIQTSDGGYAVAGATNSYGAGSYDAWLFKTDPTGNIEWSEVYGGAGGENAISLIETSEGGYALAGLTDSYGAGSDDFWLIKTDSAGKAEWNRTYGGDNYDHAWSVAQTRDGGYALAGDTKSFGAGGYDFWLVKTDASGGMQWSQAYGGTGFDHALSVVQTDDGGYALAGYTASFGAGSYDFWLVKLLAEKISAAVDIDPDTLNLKSNGEWITAYITLPQGYNVEDIVLGTVEVAGIPAAWSAIQDGVCMVKFDRAAIQEHLTNEPDYESAPRSYELTLTVTGELSDGTHFECSDTVAVLKK